MNPESKKSTERALAKKRGVRKGKKVLVLSGSYKKRTYTVQDVDLKGRVVLQNLEVLNSKKKSIPFRIHHSNLKIL